MLHHIAAKLRQVLLVKRSRRTVHRGGKIVRKASNLIGEGNIAFLVAMHKYTPPLAAAYRYSPQIHFIHLVPLQEPEMSYWKVPGSVGINVRPVAAPRELPMKHLARRRMPEWQTPLQTILSQRLGLSIHQPLHLPAQPAIK